MPAVVVDTHAITWYLARNPALSKTAEAALDQASAEGHPIYVPSVCLAELTYLVEKVRLPAAARQILIRALDDPNGPYALAILDRRVADALELSDEYDQVLSVGRCRNPDMQRMRTASVDCRRRRTRGDVRLEGSRWSNAPVRSSQLWPGRVKIRNSRRTQ